MIEESILKSNFVGRDGFKWWIGQIAPEECQGGQLNQVVDTIPAPLPPGAKPDDYDQSDPWGNRIKVRIMGYHPQNPIELPDKDLPWAQILLPSTAGSGGGGVFRSTRLTPGDSVVGFFLAGDDAQIPVILGIFGRASSPVKLGPYKRPFEPYTGYTKKNPPSAYFLNKEVGDQSGPSATPLPIDLPKEVADKVNTAKLSKLISKFGQELGEIEFDKQKIQSSFTALGSLIDSPTVSQGISTMKLASRQMKTEMKNMQKDLKILTDSIDKDAIKAQFADVLGGIDTDAFKAKAEELKGIVDVKIKERTANAKAQIKALGGGIAKDMMGKLQTEVAKNANEGIKKVYDVEFAKEFAKTKSRAKAKIKGIAEQAAFIKPLKSFHSGLPCILQNAIGGMGDAIDGIIDQLVDNMTNFTDCIMDQAIGGIMNSVIGGLTKGIMPSLGGISGILGGFSPGDFLRGKAENLQSIANMFECQEKSDDESMTVQQMIVGGGPAEAFDSLIDNILSVANTADSLTEGLVDAVQGFNIGGIKGSLGIFDFMNPSVSVPGFKSPLGECYSGPPLGCAGVKLNIFGGGGIGANARAIFGDVIGEGVEAVGSIIGIDLKSGGSGYNAAPFVEIVDTCNKGYGAVARAVIDPDPQSPTYQQVVDVIVLTPGENYPVKNTDGEQNEPVIVDHVTIINPGEDYDRDDKVIDDAGNEYTTFVDDFGRIVNVIPPDGTIMNTPEINEFPELTVQTTTGFGAILRAQLKPRPPYQGEVKQVIDCIS